MKSKLFDVIVRSTMGYGVEMWGPGYLMSTAALAGRDKLNCSTEAAKIGDSDQLQLH